MTKAKQKPTTDFGAEAYRGYCLERHGVAPFESLSPTEQERWQNSAKALIAAWVDDQDFGKGLSSIDTNKPLGATDP